MEKGGKREKEEKYYPNRNNGWQNRFDYFTCRKGEKKKETSRCNASSPWIGILAFNVT